MDGRRFDEFTKALAAGASRRTILKSLGGLTVALSGAFGRRARGEAALRAQPTRCTTDADCPNQKCCGGFCRDTTSDREHCGRCDNFCSTSTGMCCGGECADIGFDRRHCGACFQECPDAEFCAGGTCCLPEGICGAACCQAGEACVGGGDRLAECCPPRRVCAAAQQIVCCPTGEECAGSPAACCPTDRICNTKVPADPTRQQVACCPDRTVCIPGEACCPPAQVCGRACCTANEECVDGQCVPKTGAIPEQPCEDDGDCDEGSACIENVCQDGGIASGGEEVGSGDSTCCCRCLGAARCQQDTATYAGCEQLCGKGKVAVCSSDHTCATGSGGTLQCRRKPGGRACEPEDGETAALDRGLINLVNVVPQADDPGREGYVRMEGTLILDAARLAHLSAEQQVAVAGLGLTGAYVSSIGLPAATPASTTMLAVFPDGSCADEAAAIFGEPFAAGQVMDGAQLYGVASTTWQIDEAVRSYKTVAVTENLVVCQEDEDATLDAHERAVASIFDRLNPLLARVVVAASDLFPSDKLVLPVAVDAINLALLVRNGQFFPSAMDTSEVVAFQQQRYARATDGIIATFPWEGVDFFANIVRFADESAAQESNQITKEQRDVFRQAGFAVEERPGAPGTDADWVIYAGFIPTDRGTIGSLESVSRVDNWARESAVVGQLEPPGEGEGVEDALLRQLGSVGSRFLDYTAVQYACLTAPPTEACPAVAITQTVDEDGEQPCQGDQDCPGLAICCSGVCCPPEDTCLDGRCCPGAQVCEETCCDEGRPCRDGRCCPADWVCAFEGAFECCDPEIETCTDAGFCCPDVRYCAPECCGEDERCVDGSCEKIETEVTTVEGPTGVVDIFALGLYPGDFEPAGEADSQTLFSGTYFSKATAFPIATPEEMATLEADHGLVDGNALKVAIGTGGDLTLRKSGSAWFATPEGAADGFAWYAALISGQAAETFTATGAFRDRPHLIAFLPDFPFTTDRMADATQFSFPIGTLVSSVWLPGREPQLAEEAAGALWDRIVSGTIRGDGLGRMQIHVDDPRVNPVIARDFTCLDEVTYRFPSDSDEQYMTRVETNRGQKHVLHSEQEIATGRADVNFSIFWDLRYFLQAALARAFIEGVPERLQRDFGAELFPITEATGLSGSALSQGYLYQRLAADGTVDGGLLIYALVETTVAVLSIRARVASAADELLLWLLREGGLPLATAGVALMLEELGLLNDGAGLDGGWGRPLPPELFFE